MQEKSDLQLIKEIKQDLNSNSFVELVHRHEPLCHSVYNKYSTAINASGLAINDIKEENMTNFYNAVLSFKEEKNVKFSTWLSNCLRYHCLNAINKSKKYQTTEDKDFDKIEFDNASSAEPIQDKVEFVNNILDQVKDKRIKKIFEIRYGDGSSHKKKSWAVISKEIGVTQQTVINLHNKGMKIIRSKINQKDFADFI